MEQRKNGLMTGDLLKEVQNSYATFYDRTRKRWPFNTGDCLIEVTAWAGLTVNIIYTGEASFK